MVFGGFTIRIVALVVLLSAAADYCAFDRWDPTAPMSAAGLESTFSLTPHAAMKGSLHTPSSPDDHCLCCAPCIAQNGPTVAGAGISSYMTPGGSANLPFRDPFRIKRPPRA